MNDIRVIPRAVSYMLLPLTAFSSSPMFGAANHHPPLLLLLLLPPLLLLLFL